MVTATNPAGSSKATSPSTATVAAATGAPRNAQPPSITGEPRAGSRLTASNGTWSGAPATTFAYQWLRCDYNGGRCVDILGATDPSYVPSEGDPDGDQLDIIGGQQGDVGSTLRVTVTASNTHGAASAVSAPTPVITSREGPPLESA